MPNLWKESEPNGDTRENCAHLAYSAMYDSFCAKKICGICDMGRSPSFVLRGLCPRTKFDYDYTWTGKMVPGDKYYFHGYSKSVLTWDPDNVHWKLFDKGNPELYAILNTTSESYPFGTNTWYIFNDYDCLQLSKNKVTEKVYKTDLSFSTCRSNTFNCNDGIW